MLTVVVVVVYRVEGDYQIVTVVVRVETTRFAFICRRSFPRNYRRFVVIRKIGVNKRVVAAGSARAREADVSI